MAEYEFRQIMKFLTNYMKSLNMYNAIFCNSGKYVGRLINKHYFFSATYCFIMNERLLLDNHSKPVRDASNILYEEVKKHGANRHLIYIFDDDYRTAAQERDFE